MSGASLFFDRSDPIVVEVVRGDVVESVHALDAVVVDAATGDIVARAGDADRVCYFRSSLKPVQAGVCIEHGWSPSSDEQIAVASASHNAEPEHLAATRSILRDAGLDESALRCPPALPLYDLQAALSGGPQRIFRDCSGKHAAFLAASVAAGESVEDYLDPSHPVQKRVHDATLDLCGELRATGVDGCGAPTFATTLTRIARGFGRGVERYPRVASAMRAHPFLLAGTKRLDTALMENADVVAKSGAEGLACFAGSHLAGAVKSRDGWSRAQGPAVIAVLDAVGLVSSPIPGLLEAFSSPPVLGGGVPVGAMRIAGGPLATG